MGRRGRKMGRRGEGGELKIKERRSIKGWPINGNNLIMYFALIFKEAVCWNLKNNRYLVCCQ